MPRVIIVGAGFGGIAAAIELRRHGITDVTILEKADGLGGTWFHNTYPGAACDVPSHFYSFSFAQRRDWVRLCPTQPDILAYLREVVAEQGLEEIIETGTHVSACRWDDGAALDGRDEPRRAHGRRGDPGHGPAAPARRPRACRADSRATASTPPSGTTATTCAVSGSP